ncbi:ComEA family DNA-binding protein [Romeria aff. gracilis LEGE 07310]|uniref:ComEA family DNA-binding protein n=1 Tax=Vasconcelosia minhoensis LEGE 07310 TaxID=915328 RepID=A0A8J7DDK3_9CYAN|nr:ComEA family DNA-binding protein [Romeria gracilis]MBE9079972.1 ComEA family DNA-binding protein [Romeria aff. gracilis LEGE 07310]
MGDRVQPLRVRLQRDPYYRFQSVAELRLAAELGIQIDVNRAGVDDWLRLPGMSIHQARSLYQLTRSGVPLTCLEDVAAALGLSLQQLQPWAPVLQFCYYDPESPLQPQTVDANRANAEQLTQVPAIDLFLARAMVHQRQRGRYQNLADLQQRLRLPPQLTAALLHYLRF